MKIPKMAVRCTSSYGVPSAAKSYRYGMNNPEIKRGVYWLGDQVVRPRLEDDPVYNWFRSKKEHIQSSGQLITLDNPLGFPVRKVSQIGMFSLYRCETTGFIYANPRLSTSAIVDYFSGENAEEYFHGVEAGFDVRSAGVYAPQTTYLQKWLDKGSRILEVGCGTGGFLEILRDQAGFVVSGVEIAPDAAVYQTRRGVEVQQTPIEHFLDTDRFDAVLLWSVMDHFADPLIALRSCWKNIKPGGYIFIGNVNIDGFDHQIIGSEIRTFRIPSRVNFYNIRALTEHVKSAGFDIVECRTPGELDIQIVRDYWLNGGLNGRTAFLETLLLNDDHDSAALAFQTYLSDNALAGYQTILAQKR